MHENYTVCFYIRLSNEDDNEGESNSIKNQRDLLSSFVATHPELSKCRIIEFCDDGYTGVNFKRPGMSAMLEKTCKGEIHCIIVKDFSRFGRNYIETGHYLEQVFPFIGVRFISVNDRYDSQQDVCFNFDSAIKTLVYDLYSKDLSQKVKSAIQTRKQRGEFLSPFAPYGFVKSEDNKNRLCIDKDASKIVQYIFELANKGLRPKEITTLLNKENIPSPSAYKRLKGVNRNWLRVSIVGEFWDISTVWRILHDQRYIGNSLSNKSTRIRVGHSSAKSLSEKDWIVVKNTHEAIVPIELFEKVQKTVRKNNNLPKISNNERILKGLLRCHNCNRALVYVNGFYKCHTHHHTNAETCKNIAISESCLKNVLLSIIQHNIILLNDKLRPTQTIKIETEQKIKTLHNKIDLLNIEKIKNYEQYKDGKVSKSSYLNSNDSINEKISDIRMDIDDIKVLFQKSKDNSLINQLDRDIVRALVEKIIVYGADRLLIHWRFLYLT